MTGLLSDLGVWLRRGVARQVRPRGPRGGRRAAVFRSRWQARAAQPSLLDGTLARSRRHYRSRRSRDRQAARPVPAQYHRVLDIGLE